MKTKERILQITEQLLREQGVATVTTNAIADAANISVGNLYYHFHNKEEIVLLLLKKFSQGFRSKSYTDVITLSDWVAWWFDWFEAAELMPFLFQDQRYLVRCDHHIGFEYRALMQFVETLQLQCLSRLKQQEQLIATRADIVRLAKQLTFVGFCWTDFHHLQESISHEQEVSKEALRQCLSLLLPYLALSAQLQIEAQINQLG